MPPFGSALKALGKRAPSIAEQMAAQSNMQAVGKPLALAGAGSAAFLGGAAGIGHLRKSQVPEVTEIGNPDQLAGLTDILNGGGQNTSIDSIVDMLKSRSSELTISIEDSRLNGGNITLIPTIWRGQRLSMHDAIEAAVESGLHFPSFNSLDEADQFAEQRSSAGGAGTQGFLGTIARQ